MSSWKFSEPLLNVFSESSAVGELTQMLGFGLTMLAIGILLRERHELVFERVAEAHI